MTKFTWQRAQQNIITMTINNLMEYHVGLHVVVKTKKLLLNLIGCDISLAF
jgi:hypothetical protein